MGGMELVFRGRGVLASKAFASELSLEHVLLQKGQDEPEALQGTGMFVMWHGW